MNTLKNIREGFFDNVGSTPDKALRKKFLFRELNIFADSEFMTNVDKYFQSSEPFEKTVPGLFSTSAIKGLNGHSASIDSVGEWSLRRLAYDCIKDRNFKSLEEIERSWTDPSYGKQFYNRLGLDSNEDLSKGFVLQKDKFGSDFILLICPLTMDKDKNVKKLPKWLTDIKGDSYNLLYVYITGMEELEDISDLPKDMARLCITNCPKLKLSGLPKGLKLKKDFIYLPDNESKFELREIARYTSRVGRNAIFNRKEIEYTNKKPLKSTSDIRKENPSTSTTKSTNNGTRFKLVVQPDSVSPADLPEWKMDHLVLYSDDNIEVGKANKAMTFVYRSMVKYMTIGEKDGYTIGYNMKGQQVCRINVVG